MQTLQTLVNIDQSHQILIKIPESILPGEYQVVLVLNPVYQPKTRKPSFNFSNHQIKWDDRETFGRSEIYGEGGR